MIVPWMLYAMLSGALICLVGVLGEPIVRLRGQSARAGWVAFIVGIVVAPVLLNLLPQLPTSAAEQSLVRHATSPLAPLTPIALPTSSNTLVLMLWGLGSFLLTARIVGTALMLRRRRAQWVRTELDGTSVLLADELGPALIGMRRFTTVIPRWALTLDQSSRALILEHEAEHARSGDPYLRSVALVALILMPWNPALWWAMRRLRLAVEMDCDQRLLRRGVDPHKYASVLLAVGARVSATPFAWATALGDSPSSLEKRVVAMISPFRPRHPRLVIAALNVGIFAIALIACAAPVPDSLLPPSVVRPLAETEAPTHTKATTGYEVVADTLMFTCQGSREGRADTGCANGPHVFVNYRRRGSDTFVGRADQGPGTGQVQPVKWHLEADRVYGPEGVPAKDCLALSLHLSLRVTAAPHRSSCTLPDF